MQIKHVYVLKRAYDLIRKRSLTLEQYEEEYYSMLKILCTEIRF